ncbi:MAG: proline racemase family protein [Spirochaetaceae bacterium]|nr:proline racemase family protein [Spirochaetaceae bacterium]
MNIGKWLQTIDTHTMGEPTRIVVAGLPPLRGATVMEKKKDLEANYDWIRQVQIFEPRGHKDMFGAFLVEPTQPEADFGVIFSDSGGYLNMCGHGTIGVATMLVEMGYVPKVEPYTNLTLETPAGLVKVKVTVENKRVKSVTFTNVPSFIYKQNCTVNLPGVGDVTFDISFGGSFFAIIHAEQLKQKLHRENLPALVPLALKLRDIINQTIPMKHPTLPITTVDLVEIYDTSANPSANAQNVVVFGDGNVDRSPCGTGTCAKLALLYAEGKIGFNQPFVYESILGTTFTGEILGETLVKDTKAIIPQITGSAYITSINQLVIDENDPFKHGFQL